MRTNRLLQKIVFATLFACLTLSCRNSGEKSTFDADDSAPPATIEADFKPSKAPEEPPIKQEQTLQDDDLSKELIAESDNSLEAPPNDREPTIKPTVALATALVAGAAVCVFVTQNKCKNILDDASDWIAGSGISDVLKNKRTKQWFENVLNFFGQSLEQLELNQLKGETRVTVSRKIAHDRLVQKAKKTLREAKIDPVPSKLGRFVISSNLIFDATEHAYATGIFTQPVRLGQVTEATEALNSGRSVLITRQPMAEGSFSTDVIKALGDMHSARFVEFDITKIFKNKMVSYRGVPESNMTSAFSEVASAAAEAKKNGRTLILTVNLDDVVGTNLSAEKNTIDNLKILFDNKQDFEIFAFATPDTYSKHISTNSMYDSVFSRIELEQLSADDLRTAVSSRARTIGFESGLNFSDEFVELLVKTKGRLSGPDPGMQFKALDQAKARRIGKLDRDLSELRQKKGSLQWKIARKSLWLRKPVDEIDALHKELEAVSKHLEGLEGDASKLRPKITEYQRLVKQQGVIETRIATAENEGFKHLENSKLETLKKQINELEEQIQRINGDYVPRLQAVDLEDSLPIKYKVLDLRITGIQLKKMFPGLEQQIDNLIENLLRKSIDYSDDDAVTIPKPVKTIVFGAQGTGKTDLLVQALRILAEKSGRKVTDLTNPPGLARVDMSHVKNPNDFYTAVDKAVRPDTTVLFLDEFGRTNLEVQKLLFEIEEKGRIGQYSLKNITLYAASNDGLDRSIISAHSQHQEIRRLLSTRLFQELRSIFDGVGQALPKAIIDNRFDLERMRSSALEEVESLAAQADRDWLGGRRVNDIIDEIFKSYRDDVTAMKIAEEDTIADTNLWELNKLIEDTLKTRMAVNALNGGNTSTFGADEYKTYGPLYSRFKQFFNLPPSNQIIFKIVWKKIDDYLAAEKNLFASRLGIDLDITFTDDVIFKLVKEYDPDTGTRKIETDIRNAVIDKHLLRVFEAIDQTAIPMLDLEGILGSQRKLKVEFLLDEYGEIIARHPLLEKVDEYFGALEELSVIN